MSDPKLDALTAAVNIAADITTGNYAGALPQVVKLGELLAILAPPIDAPALDPGDRAAVDAEVDAEVTKP